MKRPLVLLIDDDDSLRRVMEFSLTEAGYQILAAKDGEAGMRLFEKETPSAVITDITMPGMSGLAVLKKVREYDPYIPVILITAYGTIESAVSAMKEGAFDYITKPFNRDELKLTLERALTMQRLIRENRELRAEIKNRYSFDNIIGTSSKMRELLDLAGRAAQSDATILITGESGTGKELLARGIHHNSRRAEGPFVAVNCAAFPDTLIESELFGYTKGAFTGAVKDKEGKFEQADGGTIFLDEIAEIRPDIQVKLLRVLQEREVDRLGGTRPIPLNVRVIAATNRDIEQAVRQGAFREDLYFRLSVITLNIPPLRERRDDIPLLVRHFLRKFIPSDDVVIDSEAMAALNNYA